jgi:hypothetical protein
MTIGPGIAALIIATTASAISACSDMRDPPGSALRWRDDCQEDCGNDPGPPHPFG